MDQTLTTNFPNNAVAQETIIHNYNGLVCSPYSLGTTMVEAFEIRDRLARNAKAEANKYRWNRIIPKLEKIYQNVLKSSVNH